MDEISKRIWEIENNNISGANELTTKALKTFMYFAENSKAKNLKEFLLEVECLGKSLIKAQPSMFSIQKATKIVLKKVLMSEDLESAKITVFKESSNLIDKLKTSRKKIARFGAELIGRGDCVLTHSYSSNVFEILKAASKKGIEVITTESRPQREGIKFAKEISKYVEVRVIVDSAVSYFLKSVDSVFVGGDAIVDNVLINKVGTKMIAVCSKEEKIPFYVALETLKIGFGEIEIKKMPDSEILKERENLKVENIYFDKTPLKYVTKIVTEKGVFTPDKTKYL